jgi:serine/threonine protein kinase
MASNPSSDLLFGMLALQIGLIDQGALVAAFQAWARDKSRPLAEHLEARGDLDRDDRCAVDALVARHLKKHGDDLERSLASIANSRSTRERLAALDDVELTGIVNNLGSVATDLDCDHTTTYSVGAVTSDGQRFRVLRPHARGGLGEVFVALDCELQREVALKQILDSHADDPVSRQRFFLEAEITGGLEHPGIVPVYGLGSYADGRPYYAMRFIRGDSFKEAIARFHEDEALKKNRGHRLLAFRKLLRRFLDVCNAIDYAHSRGVLHRDIKPGNVIVGKHGETLVVDWGLAKPLGHRRSGTAFDEPTLIPSSAIDMAGTLLGSALGTPAYMSPEQASGDLDHLSARSDVYSLGATLYYLLTGNSPFSGDDVGVLLRKVQKGEFPRPRQRDATVGRAIEAVCLKAMSLNADDRYATPRELADDVERLMSDEPVVAYHEPLLPRIARWARNHKVLASNIFMLILSSLLSSAGFYILVHNYRSRLAEEKRIAADFRRATTAFNTALRDVLRDLPPGSQLSLRLASTLLELEGRYIIESTKSRNLIVPMVESMTIVHFPMLTANQFDSRRVAIVGQNSFTARENDDVTVQAVLSEPAYAYLIAFRPDGTDELCDPDNDELPPLRKQQPRYPPPQKNGEVYRLSEGAGLYAFALVVSHSPLPSYREWKQRHGPQPWAAKSPHEPRVVWRVDGQGLHALVADQADDNKATGAKARGLGDPVAELARWLRGLPGVDAVALEAFPVEPASRP